MPEQSMPRKTGPLEPWEIQRERDEYVAPRLTDEERAHIKIKDGLILYEAYYHRAADADAYLDDIAQVAYEDKIVRLAHECSHDDEIQMEKANRRTIDSPEEYGVIDRAMQFKRQKFLTPEQQEWYHLASQYRALPPEEKKRITEKTERMGIALLSPREQDLYLRWKKNKYRGAWFTSVTTTILDLVREGFFDQKIKKNIEKRARDLQEKTKGQRGARKNTEKDVQEGDRLIHEALETLFPAIQGLQGDERKKELKKIFGIEETDAIDQSPRI